MTKNRACKTPLAVGAFGAWCLMLANGLFCSAAETAGELRQLPTQATNTVEWWSLKPLKRPPLPASTGGRGQSANPIDAFILAKLEEKGLRPSPEADRRTLIRRVYFDVIGLPPTPGEIEDFIRDPDQRAYEKLVNRLLASPHYGERWARHWLDVVHYGETHGYDKDKPRPNAWPYRDYVIRALNEDKPYGRFVQEQVAGDVLFPFTRDGIEALGFIAAGPWDLIGHEEVPESKIDGKVARHLDRDDMVMNTIQTFNSFTVQCAQCHNHKFDPIPTEDYYSLQAVFAALDRTDKKYDQDPAVAKKRATLENKLITLTEKQKELNDRIPARAGQPLSYLEQKIAATEKSAGKSSELATFRTERTNLLAGATKADERHELSELKKEAAKAKGELSKLPPQSVVYAGAVRSGTGNFAGTSGKPRPIFVLNRGNVLKPGLEVGPGALGAVSTLPPRFDVSAEDGEGARRAALARWLTDSQQPLTWRSMVNRVWQYHFGRGLVDTPNDFGRMGSPPTHPELLDWLAMEFRDGGQSIKKLHKLILTSATYRQVSGIQGSEIGNQNAVISNQDADADNRYLWRMNRRKLEAEAVRDSVLSISGQLDLTMGGPSFQDFVIDKPEHSPHYEYVRHDPEDARGHRRAIYRFIVRSQPQPLMAALDCADPSIQTAKRNESVSPLQALAMLNNALMLTMSKHFAQKLEQSGDDLAGQVGRAYYAALGRPPSQDLAALVAYAREFGLANFCRVLFNLNEFAFVD